MTTTRGNKSFQSVFKVELKQKHERDLDVASKSFTPRKAHKKSRGGCQSCKKRRVKCDEARPFCGRCVKLCIDECIYAEGASPAKASSSAEGIDESTPLAMSPNMYSMAVDLLETDLSTLLSVKAILPLSDGQSMSNARILQHFQAVTSTSLGCSMTRQVMHTFVARNAWSFPYLMHMVLAISCAHQRHLGIGIAPLTEATHWQRGLQLHREQLSRLKPGQCPHNWDPIVAATFLTIMYTFSLDDDIPVDSLSSTGAAFEHALAPFAAIGGFRSLYYLFPGDPDPFSKWLPVLLSTNDEAGSFTSDAPGIDGLPRAFVRLCELDSNSTVDNNPFHKIVRHLAPLLLLQPSPENFATLMAFCGRCYPYIRPLLLRKDPRGLLLVAYWLGLLRPVDQWWVRKRALTECNAIIAYLSKLQDPCIYALLPFPAAFNTLNTVQMWQMLEPIAKDTV